jgi:hypothetical protein
VSGNGSTNDPWDEREGWIAEQIAVFNERCLGRGQAKDRTHPVLEQSGVGQNMALALDGSKDRLWVVGGERILR